MCNNSAHDKIPNFIVKKKFILNSNSHLRFVDQFFINFALLRLYVRPK